MKRKYRIAKAIDWSKLEYAVHGGNTNLGFP